MFLKSIRLVLCLAAFAVPAATASAQIDARMLRQPTVSKTQIAFVYAGDIWLVAKDGGSAFKLTSSLGEESFPRFSPDGTKVAFSASYDGNQDVYVIPSAGGEPVRLTHHPMPDRVVGWTPDGRSVLFASSRESGRQRYNQFYTVPVTGGLSDKLVVPYGEFGTYSPDGGQFAYMPMAQDFRNWKRYRGGWSPDIWLFDLKTKAAKNITTNPANDAQPMWHGNTIYFISDRDGAERNNIWAYDVKAGTMKQVTHFRDFDITFPSMGADTIVFQAGGRLYLLDVPSGKQREVPVRVVTDESTLRARTVKVDNNITWASVSPTGKRALFEARGEVFSAPAEFGPLMNATRTSGVAERYPRWSPDGKLLAYWSDRSGEYELYVRPAEGAGAERKVTSLGPGFRYAPEWSRDSKKIAFIDQAMRVHVTDVESGKTIKIDESPEWMNHGGLQGFGFKWSHARDDRVPERHAADVRPGREVPVLRVGPRVRPGLRQLRQQLDVSQSDAAGRRAAAKGRAVAAVRPQRLRGRRPGEKA
jgi:tricorn protease